MSTLQIIGLESGAFKHVDSIDGRFFLGRFNFKEEFNKAFLVEAYGAKRREYVITDISIIPFGGIEEFFTNWDDITNRLVELNYTGIETEGIPFDPADYDLSEFSNDDTDPFVRASEIPEAGSSFKGDWNAETNSPTLVDGTGTLGDEYVVTVSGYMLDEIYLPGDTIYYNASNVWIKKQDNNQDISTRLPVSYINCNSGSGIQNLGEADGSENTGSINAVAAANDYMVTGNSIQNTRKFITQALAGAITNYRNLGFTRLGENMAFYAEHVVMNADASANSTSRFLYGQATFFAIGNIDPSGITGYGFGLAADSADANVQFFTKTSQNPNTGVTKVDTGWSKTATHRYYLKMYRELNSSKLFYWIYNPQLNATIKGVASFNPATIGVGKCYYKGSGTNAIASGFQHFSTKINTSI